MNERSDPPAVTHLLYLHGFRSSPRSTKARLVGERVRREHPGVTWWCPQLPPSPAAAMAVVSEGTAHWPAGRSAVIGSSLGGFYARYIGLAKAWKRALLNPAVHPARDLARHIGEQTAWHDPNDRFFFEPAFVDELQQLETGLERMAASAPVTPALQYALIAQGDEVLDWREMCGFCHGGELHVLPGSDHAISDFPEHLDGLMAFLQLAD
ncbi:MAG TPA: YqiA/YcfP family alpha/beta fold hydrolase [Hydrogenophaga sp.]|mgnify:CR=1 FL=1|uniref:YqiA/YcfP family alpha/beta fold hydrolase n=1 Tax=Hydrogenophaga sp. TaxID=1904254 RepID=UPI002CBA3106|nr:YqiA/YcfP family alpha/beta fold hydrolase [Hydrogenophaga sp.]HMN93481.1 YqiA/YcfP family alpha/beta fold hydrolase [Hydrogenophaga sp.]HMP09648.1 YqiA/YcfP family alpha/beta fold hydrolase [Hydrogenophaga sp.]